MYLALEHLAVVLGVLAVAVAMVLALQRQRSPQSSAAWILFIILVPYVAVPLFIVLGFRKQGRRFPAVDFSPLPGAATENGNAALFRALGASDAAGGHRIALHATPQAAQAALDDLLDSACERADILFYLLARDDSGRAFLARLTALARAGVQVRLGLDWLGALRRPRAELAELVAAGGEVRFFSPFLHLFDRGSLNLRNHRKLVMVDGARVWSGGRNIGDEYLAAPPGAWCDLSFDLQGPLVQSFAEIFVSDWTVAGGDPGAFRPRTAPAGTSVAQLVPAGPDEPLDVLHDGLVTMIHRAERRIWVATPYFVPSEHLEKALCTAARRGVDVRILLPARSNQRTADLARGPYLREAAAAGCRILRHQPGMMHAKAGIIDAMGWMGTANFDVRSMLLNFEMTVAVHDAPTVAALEEWFTALVRDCAEGLPATPWPKRLVEGIFRLGAPIL